MIYDKKMSTRKLDYCETRLKQIENRKKIEKQI